VQKNGLWTKFSQNQSSWSNHYLGITFQIWSKSTGIIWAHFLVERPIRKSCTVLNFEFFIFDTDLNAVDYSTRMRLFQRVNNIVGLLSLGYYYRAEAGQAHIWDHDLQSPCSSVPLGSVVTYSESCFFLLCSVLIIASSSNTWAIKEQPYSIQAHVFNLSHNYVISGFPFPVSFNFWFKRRKNTAWELGFSSSF
jgi:hypothetical protein